MASKNKRNGEGSISQRKDGRWMARYFVTMPDGSRRRQHIYDWDRNEIVRRMREELVKSDQGTPIYRDRARTVEKMARFYVSEIDPNICRPTTCLAHKNMLEKYIIPMLGHIPLSSLMPEHVLQMINELKRREVGVRSIQRIHQTLSSVLREAMNLGYIHRNAARKVAPPQYEPKERSVWTDEQVALFLAQTRDHKYYPLFAILFHYGLRRGEVLGLRWQDIDFENNFIYIRQHLTMIDNQIFIQPTKTKAGKRNLTLLPNIKKILLAHKKAEQGKKFKDDLVFHSESGSFVNMRSLLTTFHNLSRLAGLPRITIHDIRHTVATMLIDNPYESQGILGHEKVNMTHEYTHTSVKNKALALGKIAERINKYGYLI